MVSLIGTWLTMGSIMASRFLARSGFAWLTVDIEHTHVNWETTTNMLASIGWPVIDRFRFGSAFAISPHGLGIAIGFLIGSMLLVRICKRWGVDPDHANTMLMWALVGTIVGAAVGSAVGAEPVKPGKPPHALSTIARLLAPRTLRQRVMCLPRVPSRQYAMAN